MVVPSTVEPFGKVIVWLMAGAASTALTGGAEVETVDDDDDEAKVERKSLRGMGLR